jgi:hypothetical protein
MTSRLTFGCLWQSLTAGLLLVAWAGCDRAKPPEPVSVADIPRLLQAGFKDAKGPVKEAVANVVGAIEAQDWPKASLAIQSLSSQAGLKPPQQELVGRCTMAINAQMAEAAAAGNEQAEQLRQVHRLEK